MIRAFEIVQLTGVRLSRSHTWIRNYCDLHRSLKSMRDALRATAAPYQLSDTEALVLLLCADAATTRLSQRELATMTAISTAAMSGHLDSLRSRDLVSGIRDQNDRRRQTWCATERGKILVANITQTIDDSDDNIDQMREAA